MSCLNYTDISQSVSLRGRRKNRARFVETTNLFATNISGSWPTIQHGTSGRVYYCSRSAATHTHTIDLRKRTKSNAQRGEITVINIVGLAPSQFIADSCFLQRGRESASTILAGFSPGTFRDRPSRWTKIMVVMICNRSVKRYGPY